MASLPPGTQRLEDNSGEHIVLAPQPNSDPNQPLNWSTWRKTLHMTILSLYCLMVFAILCISVPLWQIWNEELGVSYATLNNTYASNMAALAVGCIMFVPVALKFGRRPVYIVTSFIMTLAALWQAKTGNAGDIYGSNVIAGLAGAVNETLFQVTVADLFFVHQRGTMNGIYLMVVLIGNYGGPIAGGYIAVNQDWPWAFWYCVIFMGLITVVMIFFLEESKYVPPVLDGLQVVRSEEQQDHEMTERKESKIYTTAASNDSDLASPNPEQLTGRRHSVRKVTIDTTIPMKTYWQRHALWTLDSKAAATKHHFFQHVWQPFQVLAIFPAVMFAALQYGFVIAMLAILAVTQASLYPFEPYNFSAIGVGNMNLPPAIGAILGSIFGGFINDLIIVKVAKRRGGIYEPETRLWTFMVPGLAMMVGALMYGLTIAKGMPWMINAVGAGFIGFSIGGCGDIALTYVQDSYQHILGDALIGVVFVRNVISTALVFAVTPWMTNMGVYNMFVILGVLSAVIALTCVPLIIWGRAWRIKLAGKYEYYAARQYS